MENIEIADMAKRPRGRPTKSDDQRAVLVPVRFGPDLLAAIDEAAEGDIAMTGRSAMVRTLCAEALAARAKRK